MLLKEVEELQIKAKTFHVQKCRQHGGDGNNPPADLQIQHNPHQNSSWLFFFRKLTSSKFTWKYMRPRIAKTLKKKNKVSGRIFFISKLSTKRIIKTE